MATHVHRVIGIRRYKTDAATIECECGHTDLIGTWHGIPWKGWNKKQWPLMIIAVITLLYSWTVLEPEMAKSPFAAESNKVKLT